MAVKENDKREELEEIFAKVLRAGRRTYFFDVRETRAGDYYLTITESKKNTNEDGTVYYKKHKIYLYKEDFQNFKDILEETSDFIIDKKGEEVISERHQSGFHGDNNRSADAKNTDLDAYTDVSFDEI